MKAGIVPIIKNKTGDSRDKNNYCLITLVTACSKILELCKLSTIENYICTHDHQFGFKKQHLYSNKCDQVLYSTKQSCIYMFP